MVYFVPCRHLFSADYHPRGGGMVYKRRCLCHRHHRVYASRHCLWRLGAGGGDHRPCLIHTADSAGRNVPAKGWQNRRHSALPRRRLFPCPAARFGHPWCGIKKVDSFPYLKRPEAAYLERLEFEYSRGIGDYGSDDYYLRGVDMTGERHSFEISEKRYEEGRALWGGNDYNLFAKVTYLPHTSTLMSLEFMTELDASGAELYPPSPELPNDWESFSIQINDAVYTLPLPLADFLDDGWVISAEDAGLSLPGAEGPYASYEWEWVSLTNDREQTVSVCAFNPTESTIPVAESTVGGVHVIYGNYDFSGTELRLPGGLMLGWSTREDVLELYGQPSDSFEAYVLTYETNDSFDLASWRLGFDDSGILDDVMVHHQSYFRSD